MLALPFEEVLLSVLPCVPVVPLEELSVSYYSSEVVFSAIDMIYQVKHPKYVGRGRRG